MLMTRSGGMVICRYISKGMFEFLESRGIARRDMSNSELEKLLVDTFGLADEVKIIEDSDEVTVMVIHPTLTDFLEEMMIRRIPIILCPFIATIIEVYSYRGITLRFEGERPTEYDINLMFSKVRA